MENSQETILMLPIKDLQPFPNHPFLVNDDDQMKQLTESICKMGVLTPVIVRKMPDESFQLISGHRRKYACEQLGIKDLPAIVREIDDDAATIMMVDSNFQREKILPSEKAHAYKLKLECIKHQGARNDLTSAQVEQKSRPTSRQQIAENSPDSSSQIQRYIRLNNLIPRLLDLVDEGKIALTPAVELSYLTSAEQELLFLTMETEQATPSLSQALRMKKLSQSRLLTDDMILAIMSEQKKPDSWNLALPMNKLSKYFPNTYSTQKMEETIFQLLDRWLAVQIKNQRKR